MLLNSKKQILGIMLLPLLLLPQVFPDSNIDQRIQKLIFDLDAQHRLVRAIKELKEMGPKAIVAVPALIKLFDKQDDSLSFRVSDALKNIGPKAVPLLIDALNSRHLHVKYWTVITLGNIGIKANASIPFVARLVDEKSVLLSRAATEALGNMGESAAPSLIEALYDSDERVRTQAAKALKRIAPDNLDIFKALSGKPRAVKVKITYDVPPIPELHKNIPSKNQITFAPIKNPSMELVLKDGDIITPGIYILKISRDAYQTIKKEVYIWPKESPFIIEEELRRKWIEIRFNLSYDLPPPDLQEQADYTRIYMLNTAYWKGSIAFIRSGRKRPPGLYMLLAISPGYHDFRKEVELLPQTSPFTIDIKLKAKPRNLYFEVMNLTTNTLVPLRNVIDARTGKKISTKDFFQPGNNYEFIFQFEKHQTVQKIIQVMPGEGPVVVLLSLKRLKR